MDVDEIKVPEGKVFRFKTDRGDVCIVVIEGETPELRVYEKSAALAASQLGMSDTEFRRSAFAGVVRNRFGIKRIRPMLRHVRAAYPNVKWWKLDPVVRRNPVPMKTVEVA